MKSNDAILIALLVVLVLIVAFQGSGWMKNRNGCDGFAAGAAGPASSALQAYPPGAHNPYTVLNKQIDALRGYRNDGYNQPPLYRHPRGLDAYHRAGAYLRPEDLAEAERAQWYAAVDTNHSGAFNTELASEPAADAMQYHSPEPGIDYDSYVTDLVVDPRTRDNHRRWVEEMKPWSGTAMKVDNLDIEPTIDFIGLRRPQAVAQHNPLQLTEIDSYDLAQNPKFNFRG